METNKVRYGLKNLHISFAAAAAANGTPQWEEPISIPGITECSRTSQVNSNDFYADDGLYYRANADTGDDISVTTAYFPDAVKARMLGWAIDAHGALVRTPDGTPEEFAMAFETAGDKQRRRKVIYSCIASVPDESDTTKGENVEVKTETMSIRSKAIELGGKKVVDAVLNEGDSPEAFAAFFDSVGSFFLSKAR